MRKENALSAQTPRKTNLTISTKNLKKKNNGVCVCVRNIPMALTVLNLEPLSEWCVQYCRPSKDQPESCIACEQSTFELNVTFRRRFQMKYMF